MIVNGREYPLWSQFVEKKYQYLGKKLVEENPLSNLETTIIDIRLVENGKDSAMFKIIGEDFSCGFDVQYGGISSENKGIVTFSGYMGHTFFIK